MEPIRSLQYMCLLQLITCPLRCVDVWFYFLLYFSLAFVFTACQQGCTYLIPVLRHISHLFLYHFLLKLDDLFCASVSQWSFEEIAKEKFSMPVRDNYQTVKLPHSSHRVITFPCLFFFSSNETISL